MPPFIRSRIHSSSCSPLGPAHARCHNSILAWCGTETPPITPVSRKQRCDTKSVIRTWALLPGSRAQSFRSIKLRGLLKQNKYNPNTNMRERAPEIKNIGEREKLWQGRCNAQVKTLSPAVNRDRPTSIPSPRTVFKSATWSGDYAD